MTTKAEERKALEKIRNIVEGLGEDSYVGRAFDGCFDIAEENINSDFWDSWRSRAAHFEILMNEAEDNAERMTIKYNQLAAEQDELRSDCKAWMDKARERKEYGDEMYLRFREQEVRAVKLEEEIIKLKAKLYDLITAE